VLGGAAAWPVVACAGARADAADRRAHAHGRRTITKGRGASRFHQGLLQLSWTEGRNMRIDARWKRRADVLAARGG
jgi:hypothetical protein